MSLIGVIKKPVGHDIGPDIELLWMGDDDGHNLYTVRVNGRVDGELLTILFEDSKSVRFMQAGEIADEVTVPILNWTEEHRIVREMFDRIYPGCAVRWFAPGELT